MIKKTLLANSLNKPNRIMQIVLSGLLFVSVNAWALTYSIPFGNTVGEYYEVNAKSGDSIASLARRYDIGVYEMSRANQHLRGKYLRNHVRVIVPARFKLPSGDRQGIILNLATMRVFHYHGGTVSTYPAGIGRMGWGTPLGRTTIVRKRANPSWTPPPSIHREAARKGKTLRSVYPAGPNNPLGLYAMNLGFKGILMHGTNAPSSIGLRSSHGCIRLYPEDIQELFHNTSVGTPVRIVYEP